MEFTQRFCHLAHEPFVEVGSIVKPGDRIGYMGTSGLSTGPHLHTDGVRSLISRVYRLSDMESGIVVPDPVQCAFFIDGGLFGYTEEERSRYLEEDGSEPIVITTFYADPRYRYKGRFKLHCGYDLYPYDSEHWHIYWNRTKDGYVLSKGFDPGYGYYINVGYEI